jgi:lipopolysaccharide transport system ATP-binding protein
VLRFRKRVDWMNQTVIQAEGLGKRYRRGSRATAGSLHETLSRTLRSPLSVLRSAPEDLFWALRDVSLEVREGEILGLIGCNGAGKTTLLKILTRITRPTTGWAEIRGRVRSLLEVGTGFNAELTGRENTYLSGSILGMGRREIERKFEEIVAFAEIDKFIDTPVKHYSSGMYVRLAFAVAAHLEPEILLVDEVLAVGDASFQKKCIGKMSEVSRQGRTIVFVSHNMTAMRKLCTRALWIDRGQIVDRGDAGKVIDHYLQRNTESRLESVWEEKLAPGDNRMRLRSVRVIPPEDAEGLISVHSPLQIEFTYWNYVSDTVLNVSMLLFNSDDVCVFVTVSDFAPRPIGLVRQVVEIPGNFLNVGSYYVNLIIVKDASVGLLFQNNVVAFEVAEGEVVGNWYGQTPGAVRPKLRWKSDVIEIDETALSSGKINSTKASGSK